MSIGFIFWLLMILLLIFGGVSGSGMNLDPRFRWGGGVLLYVLLFLLGWSEFGFMIHR